MKRETIRALAAINRAFYTDTQSARAFDTTRGAPWAGWGHLLPLLPSPGELPLRVLDIGCGNGRFARFLADRAKMPLHYVGLDASQPLLDVARGILPPQGCRFEWKDWDFLDSSFPPGIADQPFDLIVLFGLLHHVPSFALRRVLLMRASAHLAPTGILALAFWRFGEEPRFKRRILPWRILKEHPIADAPTIDPEDLEPGDHLLAWGEETGAPRYCHAVDAQEEKALLATLPLECVDAYYADGREKRLNHYCLLQQPISKASDGSPLRV